MSSAHGAGETRQRAQKHKNSFAFKNNLHDKTPQQIRINALNVSEVCQRCKAQIEWKIRYKKYKPLSQAKTCIRCNQRNVKKAYHVACKDCARAERCCAKCLKSAEEVDIEPAEPTPREEQKIKVEMDRLIKSLPERKRRTFLRFMKRGKDAEGADGDAAAAPKTVDEETTDGDEPAPVVKRKRVPHTRADLLNKIEALRLADEDDNDNDDGGESDEENTDSDEYDCEYSDELDSDDLEEEAEEETKKTRPVPATTKS